MVSRYVALFLISNMASSLLGQLQIFRELHLIELLRFFGSGATWAVDFDISKAFNRVCHSGPLHNFKVYEISGQVFGLSLPFLSNKQLWVVLDQKSFQEYPVNVGVPQGSILGPTLFLVHINDLPDDVICNIAIYSDDTTL